MKLSYNELYKSHGQLVNGLNKFMSLLKSNENLNDETKMARNMCEQLSSTHVDASEHFMYSASKLFGKINRFKREENVNNEEENFHDTVSHFSSNIIINSPYLSSSNLMQDSKRVPRRQIIKPRPNISNFKTLISVMKNVNFGVYSLPVSVGFNEPISYIQKAVEQFEYSYLLDKAAEFTSREQTLEQMIYLVGFDMASYSTIDGRKKPFSPLLNETYECDRVDDLGWRFVGEHHGHFPPSYAAVKIKIILRVFFSKRRIVHFSKSSWTKTEFFSVFPLNSTVLFVQM
jgi:hypothetical protein